MVKTAEAKCQFKPLATRSCGASVVSQAYPYLIRRECDPDDNNGGNLVPNVAGGFR